MADGILADDNLSYANLKIEFGKFLATFQEVKSPQDVVMASLVMQISS